jgi:hypothetical protein
VLQKQYPSKYLFSSVKDLFVVLLVFYFNGRSE